VSKFLKYHSFLLGKIKEKKNCKDLGVGQDLTENPNGLVIFFFLKKKKMKDEYTKLTFSKV
jgi:hypothetical protein